MVVGCGVVADCGDTDAAEGGVGDMLELYSVNL